MSVTKESSLTEILRNYLSHIVYIDDEFKVSWQVDEGEEIRRPGRSKRRVKQEEDVTDEVGTEKAQVTGMESFCVFVQNNYPNILLSPIQYTKATDGDRLKSHMQRARLLILDWSLSDKITAINLLQSVNFSEQLRFCVIYTSNLDLAKTGLTDNISYIKEQGFDQRQYEGKNYEYVRVDATIYMLCEKDKFNFDMIIGALTEIFTREVGYFPIAFIDMISRLESKVPHYLNKFSQPFDKLMLLQTNSNGLPLEDVYHSISDMVINNIKADINLNDKVLENIYTEQIKALTKLVKNKEIFEKQLKVSLEVILSKIKCPDKDKNIFLQVKSEDYRTVVEKAISKPKELSKGIDAAGNLLAKKYAEALTQSKLKEAGLNEGNNIIKKELKSVYEQRCREKIKKVLPACLMILTNPQQSYDINNLILSLKTFTYEEKGQYFCDIFNECYDEQNGIMQLKCYEKGVPNRNLLQNKLNPGDIIFKGNFETEGLEECYLCIVPSCHLLRPKKVDGNILCLKGIIYESHPEKELRHNEHLTMLPSLRDGNLPIYVIWQYHDVKTIDLNQMPKDNYELYYRPYRLSYEYIRQIVGEFVSFYSKSGVEELFLKSDSMSYDLLISEGVVGS